MRTSSSGVTRARERPRRAGPLTRSIHLGLLPVVLLAATVACSGLNGPGGDAPTVEIRMQTAG